MNDLFAVHMLNETGKQKAKYIANHFNELLLYLEDEVGTTGSRTREFALCRTQLEQACIYAKKSMAMQKSNQEEI